MGSLTNFKGEFMSIARGYCRRLNQCVWMYLYTGWDISLRGFRIRETRLTLYRGKLRSVLSNPTTVDTFFFINDGTFSLQSGTVYSQGDLC